ncbi:MAG: hypothetical protein VX976_01945 [Pseudomonadota bacterium]|nr:hypothetical protein [Pseudomonadota bacterium]
MLLKSYIIKLLKCSFIIISLILLNSCSGLSDYFSENKFYYKSGYNQVKLNTEDENVKNIHPIKIDPLRIEGALKLVLTRFGKKPQQLFVNEKVFDYAVAISEALIEAESNQDVIFTIEGWYKQKGLSANRVTSGRIFYNKSGLNMIFGSILRKGNMQETDPMLAAGINPDLKTNPYAPGSRFQTIRNEFKLSALPNSGVFRPRSVNRSDWLVFTTRALKARSFPSRQEQNLALRSNIEVEGLKNEVQNLRKELQSMRDPRQQYGYGYNYPPNYRQAPYNMNAQPPYANYPNQNRNYYQQYPNTQTNVHRNQLSLKSLESMRERGLISEENYLKKLKELGY